MVEKQKTKSGLRVCVMTLQRCRKLAAATPSTNGSRNVSIKENMISPALRNCRPIQEGMQP
jgi:hypothetical protein